MIHTTCMQLVGSFATPFLALFIIMTFIAYMKANSKNLMVARRWDNLRKKVHELPSALLFLCLLVLVIVGQVITMVKNWNEPILIFWASVASCAFFVIGIILTMTAIDEEDREDDENAIGNLARICLGISMASSIVWASAYIFNQVRIWVA